MNSSVSIKKEIMERAAKKAKEDNMSVSAVMRTLLNDYANGKIHITTQVVTTPIEPQLHIVKVDAETQGLMDDVVNEWNKTQS